MFKKKLKNLKSAFTLRKKPQRSDSSRCLTENNNNIQDGYANPLVQNIMNSEEEKHLQKEEDVVLLELFELLGAFSDAPPTSEDGSCCSGQHNMQLRVVGLTKKLLSQIFPKPPADLDQSLQLHLLDVQNTVFGQLERLGPLFESRGMMGCLVHCCHSHTFDHLHGLIQNVSSFKSALVLMDWVEHTYLSQEILCRPDHQIYSDWEVQAKEKLLEHAQKETRENLSRILQNERGHYDDEEAYGALYVDTIQCVAAMPRKAEIISSELKEQVQEVCYRELLTFVTRYDASQKEFLERKAEADQPETIHFLKTLKTCKELRQHAQNEGIEKSLLTQTVATLDDLEAFTLKLLRKIVADVAELHLKNYFRADSRRLYLFAALENLFPKRSYVLDVQKRVMDEAYEIVAHVYLKYLIQSSRRKLEQRWSPNVEQTVREDAEQLHSIMADLAPGVHQWNQMLLKIPEVLDCEDIDALKMTVAHIEKECSRQSEDLKLIPALLRWKGLSRRGVREVMEALPSSEPDPGSRPWFSCLICN